MLRRLAGLPRPPREATGVDVSPAMLARGGELPAGWRTLRADARATDLPAGCADVVTCAYVLHLLTPADRAAVLAEARRLLSAEPHARLVIVTVHAQRPAVAALLRAAARLGPRWRGLRPLDPSAELREAGFCITRRALVPRRGYPSLVLVARPDSAYHAGHRHLLA